MLVRFGVWLQVEATEQFWPFWPQSPNLSHEKKMGLILFHLDMALEHWKVVIILPNDQHTVPSLLAWNTLAGWDMIYEVPNTDTGMQKESTYSVLVCQN